MKVANTSIVWLPVSDLDRAIDFYCQKLGLEEKQHEDQWAELSAGDQRIGLNSREKETSGGEGGAVIAFTPDEDLDSAVEHLRERGIEFPGEISEHPWGRIATFKDLDGNDLQLYEPPKN